MLFMRRCNLAVSLWLGVLLAGSPVCADGLEEGTGPASVRVMGEGDDWSIRLGANSPVQYQGMIDAEAVSAEGRQMMYPGQNAAAFLVGVITHGVLLAVEKSSARRKIEDEANKVLTPYQDVLSRFTLKDLIRDGMGKISLGGQKTLVEPPSKASAYWVVESVPVFYLTQDQTAIVMDNVISVFTADSSETPVYTNVVRVVANPLGKPNDAAAKEYWLANEGEKLKQQSAILFAESLHMALAALSNKFDSTGLAYKTIRYSEGSTEKMERAIVLNQKCDRQTIKTLRGWLMSVPSRNSCPGFTGG